MLLRKVTGGRCMRRGRSGECFLIALRVGGSKRGSVCEVQSDAWHLIKNRKPNKYDCLAILLFFICKPIHVIQMIQTANFI